MYMCLCVCMRACVYVDHCWSIDLYCINTVKYVCIFNVASMHVQEGELS